MLSRQIACAIMEKRQIACTITTKRQITWAITEKLTDDICHHGKRDRLDALSRKTDR